MADNNINLVNLECRSKVGLTLIERFSEVMKWLMTRDTPSRIAEKSLISDIQKSNLDPVEKAILIQNSKKILRELENKNEIVKIAVQHLHEDAKPQEISNQWVTQFEDKSGLISDSDFQLIWGKILAEEANDPGVVPPLLLHILTCMEKQDAETFNALCRYTITAGNDEKGFSVYPMIDTDNIKKYEGISYGKLMDLSALGLIKLSETGMIYQPDYGRILSYFNENYTIAEDVPVLNIGNVVYTRAGLALYQAIDGIEEVPGFMENICIPYWERKIAANKALAALRHR